MAAPRHGFRTHQHKTFTPGTADQRFEICFKFFALHVVREAAERKISPSFVDRILFRVAKSAETGDMQIFDSFFLEARGQTPFSELRIVSGFRNRSNINN